MTSAEVGALVAGAILAVILLGLYVLVLMVWEGVDGLRRMMVLLRGDRR